MDGLLAVGTVRRNPRGLARGNDCEPPSQRTYQEGTEAHKTERLVNELRAEGSTIS